MSLSVWNGTDVEQVSVDEVASWIFNERISMYFAIGYATLIIYDAGET